MERIWIVRIGRWDGKEKKKLRARECYATPEMALSAAKGMMSADAELASEIAFWTSKAGCKVPDPKIDDLERMKGAGDRITIVKIPSYAIWVECLKVVSY
jgi:hypothetical protein